MKYKGKVTLFRSLECSTAVSVVSDPKLGWRSYALGDIEIIDCPSDHLGMLTERFQLRPIRTGDGPLLNGAERDAFVSPLDESNNNPESFRDNLADFIAASKQDEILLLFDNDNEKCVGYSGGHIDNEHADLGHLRWMWVDPSLRGHGLDSMLIKKKRRSGKTEGSAQNGTLSLRNPEGRHQSLSVQWILPYR